MTTNYAYTFTMSEEACLLLLLLTTMEIFCFLKNTFFQLFSGQFIKFHFKREGLLACGLKQNFIIYQIPIPLNLIIRVVILFKIWMR